MRQVKVYVVFLVCLSFLFGCNQGSKPTPNNPTPNNPTPVTPDPTNPTDPTNPSNPSNPSPIRGTITGKISQFSGPALAAPETSRPILQVGHLPDKFPQDISALQQKAAQEGTVRVIATLATNTGFQAEGLLRTQSAVDGQRSSIALAQQSLISSLSSLVSNVVAFETVPLVAMTVDAAGLNRLASHPNVVFVHEDVSYPVMLAESTEIVGAPTAWQSGYDGKGWTVAVVDTGVEKEHPFFGGRVVAEGCFSTTDPANALLTTCPDGTNPEGVDSQVGEGAGAPCASDVFGCFHGTHVAGIVAGKGDTFSGVANGANIIAVQVFYYITDPLVCSLSTGKPTTRCASSSESDIIRGLEYVYSLRNDYKIAAVNLSLGGEQAFTACDTRPIQRILSQLRSVGIAPVVAAGNNGFTQSLSMPACASSAISVGSTSDGSNGSKDSFDTVSTFSNSAAFLDVLAPGSAITSSLVSGEYGLLSGTSMAAPHVAGAWAVLKQKFPTESVDAILNRLIATGNPIKDTKNGITKSRLQLDAALEPNPVSPLVVALFDATTGAQYKYIAANADHTYEFKDVPKGNYYVKVFLDLNKNGQQDLGELTGYTGGAGSPKLIKVENDGETLTADATIGMPFERENNNSITTANLLLTDSVIYGETEADLFASDQGDVYKLLIPQSGVYVAETLGASCNFLTDMESADTKLTLYDATGLKLSENDDIGGTEASGCSRIEYTFSAGTYFLRVEASSFLSGGMPYRVSFRKS